MGTMLKPHLLKASVVAVVAILLGLLLSALVYFATENVRKNARDLVEHRIPTLTSINQIIADVNEQERILFEYYATQEQEQFWQAYNENKSILSMHVALLSQEERLAKTVSLILSTQTNIEQLITTFHQAMQLNEDNWDFLRETLNKVSSERKKLLPELIKVEQFTESVVSEGHANTLLQMNTTRRVVIFYGISIVILAMIIARYIQQYMLLNVQNDRLALFSQENPHPILSVNANGDITYANPACSKLLANVGLSDIDIHQLLPQRFSILREQMTSKLQSNLSIEQSLGRRHLQLNINWLKQIDAFDIHVHDITEQKSAEQKVLQLAYFDQNTQLPNLYKMNENIDNFIHSNESFMLGLFSIRNFERFISTIGIEATNELVKTLASLFEHRLADSVQLFKINQSQFAILHVSNSPHLCAQLHQEKLTEMLSAPVVTKSGEFFIELDFGFSFYPEHSDNKDSMYQNALMALAIASEQQHINSVVFEPAFANAIQQKSILTDNLRLALERDELYLVFQPQLSLKDKTISGVETLVRWKRDGQIISPADFIPLAEQSGLIVPIGTWILQQACLFAKRLIANGYSDIMVAVNVSPRQFTHPGFTHSVMKALSDTGVPAKNLELEITEGVFLHNELSTLTVLNQLKSLGVCLSIDDFGTGYSSLSYLKKFPVDTLKIDQAFIKDCHNSEDDKVLIKTITALGHSLGMSIIAEGTELEVHIDYLKQINCDNIQGYWFSKPKIADEIIAFIDEYYRHATVECLKDG